MWKLIILPLLCSSLVVSAQNDTLNRMDIHGKKTGHWISRDPAGHKLYEGSFRDGQPFGPFVRFHPNGKPKAEMNYLPDGKSVEARLMDPEGRLRAEGIYLNKLKEGLWTFYSENKTPVYRISYRSGKVHGTAMRYDANGAVMEQTQWTDNALNGLQVIFYPDNKQQARINYSQGVISGEYELLFPDGKREVHGVYSAGLKNGKWIYYQEDGQTDYVLNYKNGKLLNPEILDARQRESFNRYEKNRLLLRDPQEFMNNPEELLIR